MNKKKAADRACFQLLFVSINIELSVATASLCFAANRMVLMAFFHCAADIHHGQKHENQRLDNRCEDH